MNAIQPIHVLFTLIASVLTVCGFLYRISDSVARMNFKMDLMWTDYAKRFGLNGKDHAK